MKLSFRQTGGFMGLARGCNLDTNTLSQSEAAAIERLVADSEIQQSGDRRSAQGNDLTTYEIVIERPDTRVSVKIDDMSLSPQVLPLVEYLQERSSPIPLR